MKTENNTQPKVINGVPVWRFYAVMVIAFGLGFLAGSQYGKSVVKVDSANSIIEMQKGANDVLKEHYTDTPNNRDGIIDYLLHD